MGLLTAADKEKIKRVIPKANNKIIDATVARLEPPVPRRFQRKHEAGTTGPTPAWWVPLYLWMTWWDTLTFSKWWISSDTAEWFGTKNCG